MATIKATTNEKIFQIKKWLGLNENPDGDTKLKMGEAAECLNWKITRDGNLQRRPGQSVAGMLYKGKPVKGIWYGRVGAYEYVLAACNGKAYVVYNGYSGEFSVSEIGSINTDGSVHIFGFAQKAYFLNGTEYKVWDGTNNLADVDGYVPLILVSTAPAGGGTELEQINKLNGKRRVRFSPDGAATTFHLPENDLNSIDDVIYVATGATVSGTVTKDKANGTVDISPAPAAGSNTIEISYTAKTNFATQVKAMRYSEIYNGTQDSRVFLYGDGSNNVFYSGLDYDGNPRADYFPDMNVAAIGASNTPVTGLIRHYSRLMAFKTDSAYSITYGSITLESGLVTAGFYVVPVNRTIGNAAMGQVQLVLNSPRTLFGDDLYEWKNNASYASNLSIDERQAQRISDRVWSTLAGFSTADCVCYDDNANQEYYVCYNGTALVHNYAADAWYKYDSMDVTCMTAIHGRLLYGTSDGAVVELTDSVMDDIGEWVDPEYDDSVPPVLVTPGYYERKPIEAYWESGAMDFGMDYRRKYSSMVWVSVKPQTASYVEMTILTDRKSEFADKAISTGVSTNLFGTWDFNTLSFFGNVQPQVKRVKLKAKKFTYYRLIFKNDMADTTATILEADMRVRTTGYVK